MGLMGYFVAFLEDFVVLFATVFFVEAFFVVFLPEAETPDCANLAIFTRFALRLEAVFFFKRPFLAALSYSD